MGERAIGRTSGEAPRCFPVRGNRPVGGKGCAVAARDVAVALLSFAVLAAFGSFGSFVQPLSAQATSSLKIHGVSLEAPRRPTTSDQMAAVADLGADWVAVIPFAFIRRESGDVVFDRNGQYWGERTEGVRVQVEQARAHGMRILLKPQVWMRAEGAGGSNWAGDWLPSTEAAWRTWQVGYRAYILGAARVARDLELDMLCVGTELSLLAEARPGYFRALINEVRAIYDGPLTYAANWDAYDRTPFWDQLDYIGVDAYFPLSGSGGGNADGDGLRASVTALEAAWQPIVEELERFAERHELPVLFTEWGYRSVEGAHGAQWLLPPEGRTDPALVDYEAQARAYEALFRSWWSRPWFAGGFFWEWHLGDSWVGSDGPGSADSSPGSERERRIRAVRSTGFTPEGKPAEAVVRRWYGSGAETAVERR